MAGEQKRIPSANNSRFKEYLTPQELFPDSNIESAPFARLRNFQLDVERLSNQYRSLISEAPVVSSSVDSVGQPLPNTGLAGRPTKIHTFKQINQSGQSWGITSVASNLVKEGRDTTDAQLLNELNAALRELGMTVEVYSAQRCSSNVGAGSKSRHCRGKALDLSIVNGRSATLQNPNAVKLVQWFIAHGYTPGRELPGRRGLLFGPCGHQWNKTRYDHTTHIHISLP